MTWETIKLTQDDEFTGIFTLTLNRPNSMNALNTQMAVDILDCLDELKYNKEIRVLILTALEERSFCVGADLKERDGMTNEQWKRQHDIFEDAYEGLRDFPYPVIGAINGYALGGGLEMALSCDFRIAADHAKMGLPEVKIGIIPGVGGTQLLPRSIPVGLAKEFLFRGNHISAERAREVGLVNDTVPAANLLEVVNQIAQDISVNAPLSLKSIKQAVNTGMQTDLHTALTIELSQYYKCADSEDRLEGVQAFNEKRQPNWQGK